MSMKEEKITKPDWANKCPICESSSMNFQIEHENITIEKIFLRIRCVYCSYTWDQEHRFEGVFVLSFGFSNKDCIDPSYRNKNKGK